jgi:hypothetical protein
MPPGDQAILAVIHDAVRAERSNLMTNAPTYEVILTDAPDTFVVCCGCSSDRDCHKRGHSFGTGGQVGDHNDPDRL